MIYAIVILILLIIDQAAKHLALINLPLDGPAQEFIPGIIDLLRVHNKGAAFSLFDNLNVRWALVILSVVFAGVVIFMIATRRIEGPFGRWMAAVVIAGALGNAIDRALFGYVIDMLRFHFWERFPVFNAADIYLTLGGVALCLYVIFHRDYDAAQEDEAVRSNEAPRPVRRVRYEEPPQIGANAAAVSAATRRNVSNPAAPPQPRRRAPAVPPAAPPVAAPAVSPEPQRPAIEEFMNPMPRPAATQPRQRPAAAQGQGQAPAPRPRPAEEVPRQPRPAQQAPARRPAPPAAPSSAAPQVAQRPVRPAKPSPAPQERRPAAAPRPRPEKVFDINEDIPEFSLDDILAEFSDKR